jgi:hypothetical protein
MSTAPVGSSVAVCSPRAVTRLPTLVHCPVAGSYSSVLVTGALLTLGA